MISLTQLRKSFGSHHVLKGIDLTFEKGKIYGIVGANGAGKTTLFRCIAGLEEYSGTIISSEAPLKNHLGLLQAEPFFFSRMTGREYIQLLCNARQKNIDRIDTHNMFELPLDQYVSTYSTGMKKKLALTAILLQDNPYVILDEPFNGVDIQSNILLIDLINDLRNQGKCVLISSHIFSTLSDTCDEIHLLQNGQITSSATKPGFSSLEELLRQKAEV